MDSGKLRGQKKRGGKENRKQKCHRVGIKKATVACSEEELAHSRQDVVFIGCLYLSHNYINKSNQIQIQLQPERSNTSQAKSQPARCLTQE